MVRGDRAAPPPLLEHAGGSATPRSPFEPAPSAADSSGEMADKGFWSRLFGPTAPAAPTLSFDELERLHDVFLDPENQVVSVYNKSTLIEALRALAEVRCAASAR